MSNIIEHASIIAGKVFSSWFVILNPLIIVGPYLGLTARMSDVQRNTVALKSCLFSFVMLVAVAFCGNSVLGFLGISTFGLQLAGSVLLFRIALQMLSSEPPPSDSSEKDEKGLDVDQSVAFFPLGFPIIVGPGALTVMITSAAQFSPEVAAHYPFVMIPIMVVVIGAIFICLRFSQKIADLLGNSSMTIIQKFVGLILLCFSAQMAVKGIQLATLDYQEKYTQKAS